MIYEDAIKHIYPDIVPNVDFYVKFSEEDGFTIEGWTYPKPIPSVEELNIAWENYQANPPPISKTEIQILTEKNEQLEKELAVTKEDNIANMLAITEIYEMMLGGGV
jgi:XkdW protein